MPRLDPLELLRAFGVVQRVRVGAVECGAARGVGPELDRQRVQHGEVVRHLLAGVARVLLVAELEAREQVVEPVLDQDFIPLKEAAPDAGDAKEDAPDGVKPETV